jgi:hypothetical protein
VLSSPWPITRLHQGCTLKWLDIVLSWLIDLPLCTEEYGILITTSQGGNLTDLTLPLPNTKPSRTRHLFVSKLSYLSLIFTTLPQGESPLCQRWRPSYKYLCIRLRPPLLRLSSLTTSNKHTKTRNGAGAPLTILNRSSFSSVNNCTRRYRAWNINASPAAERRLSARHHLIE